MKNILFSIAMSAVVGLTLLGSSHAKAGAEITHLAGVKETADLLKCIERIVVSTKASVTVKKSTFAYGILQITASLKDADTIKTFDCIEYIQTNSSNSSGGGVSAGN